MRKRTRTFVTSTVLLVLALMVEGRAIGAEPNQQPSPNEWAVRLAGRILRGTVKVQKTIPDTDGDAQLHKCILTVSDVIEGEAIPGDTITFESPRPTEGAVIAVFSSLGPHTSGPVCLAETPKNLDLVTKVICGCRWDDVDGNIRNLTSKREAARNISAWNLFRIAKPAQRELKTVYRLSVPPKERDAILSKALEKYGHDVTKAVVSLAKADHQASKHVYMFQQYVYPNYSFHSVRRSKRNYTGTWKAWYENGDRSFQGDLQNGEKHGKEMHWFEDGRLSSIVLFEHGFRTQASFWFKDGNRVEIICGYHQNEQHGLRILIDKKRATFERMWFFKGKVVTEQEFREEIYRRFEAGLFGFKKNIYKEKPSQ